MVVARPNPAGREEPEAREARRVPDRQRAIADRNMAAILDAAEALFQDRAQVSISAVAKLAGVSRVTVYAHFPTWEALLEAAVERAVRTTMNALHAVGPDDGPADQALDRMLAAAWRHLASYGAMAQAVAEHLSPEAVARTHHAAQPMLGGLLERGRADGSFRTDLPAEWLVTACLALIHAGMSEVRAGRIADRDAPAILTASIRGLFGAAQTPEG